MDKVLRLFDGGIRVGNLQRDRSYSYIVGKLSRGFYSWTIGYRIGSRDRKLTVVVSNPEKADGIEVREFFLKEGKSGE